MSWEGSQMSLSYCWKLTTHWHRTSLNASLSGHFLFTTSTTVPDSLQLYIHVLGLNINFFTHLSICTCDLDNYLCLSKKFMSVYLCFRIFFYLHHHCLQSLCPEKKKIKTINVSLYLYLGNYHISVIYPTAINISNHYGNTINVSKWP